MRARRTSLLVLSLPLLASGCGSGYAGRTRAEAITIGNDVICKIGLAQAGAQIVQVLRSRNPEGQPAWLVVYRNRTGARECVYVWTKHTFVRPCR